MSYELIHGIERDKNKKYIKCTCLDGAKLLGRNKDEALNIVSNCLSIRLAACPSVCLTVFFVFVLLAFVIVQTALIKIAGDLTNFLM